VRSDSSTLSGEPLASSRVRAVIEAAFFRFQTQRRQDPGADGNGAGLGYKAAARRRAMHRRARDAAVEEAIGQACAAQLSQRTLRQQIVGNMGDRDRGKLGRPGRNAGLCRRHRGLKLDQVCEVAVIGKMLFCYVGWPAFLRLRDQLTGGEPCDQSARPRPCLRLDQPAHLGVEPRHDGVHIAKLATDQAKTCGEVFKIGRHDNSSGETPVQGWLACLCSGAMVSQATALIASEPESTPPQHRCEAVKLAPLSAGIAQPPRGRQ
jgi:hypothetical protein